MDTIFIFQPTYLKNFNWVRTYDMKYDLTKGIKFTFSATNNAIIKEPNGIIDSDSQDPFAQQNYSDFLQSLRNVVSPLDKANGDR